MPSTRKSRTASSNFRKPPVQHQFKKGTSGNPNGRPRKKAVQPGGGLGGGITDRLAAMALDEALRPVTVREGDKVSEIPAMQALFRTMFRAAAGGDTKAGRQLLDVISQAESGRTGKALEVLEYGVQYKEKFGPIFEKHEREGLPPPDIFPHPDDVIINAMTGEVTIDGPTSKEQAGAQKAVREQALNSLMRYFEVEAALKKDPKNTALKQEFKELKKLYEFLKKDSDRKLRHEAFRQSRLALEPKPAEPEQGDAAESDVVESDVVEAGVVKKDIPRA
jgi:hypothetical protein